MSDDSERKARRTYTFWSLYIIDKSLSLRLGRASTIQDFDVSIRPGGVPFKVGTSLEHTWSRMMELWIQFASIQGRVYEKLYSPAALLMSLEKRTESAMNLAQELEELRRKWSNVSDPLIPCDCADN